MKPLILRKPEVLKALKDGSVLVVRALNLQPLPGRRCVHYDGARWYTRDATVQGSPIDSVDWACPHPPGSQVWVKEAWCPMLDS